MSYPLLFTASMRSGASSAAISTQVVTYAMMVDAEKVFKQVNEQYATDGDYERVKVHVTRLYSFKANNG